MKFLKSSATHFVLCAVAAFTLSCGSSDKAPDPQKDTQPAQAETNNTPQTDPMQNKGIGPVASVELSDLDPTKVSLGETLFTGKCSACHKIEEKYVGPALKGITTRRAPEWIMNMILNPSEMTEKDPIAKDLLAQFLSPMANQGLTQDEARNILEYFRSIDSK